MMLLLVVSMTAFLLIGFQAGYAAGQQGIKEELLQFRGNYPQLDIYLEEFYATHRPQDQFISGRKGK